MKSAAELAMERFDQKHGKKAPLTEKQKKAIAEIDEQLRARIAEFEIMLKPEIAAARATGNIEAARENEEKLRRSTAKAREDAEEEKERIRNG